MFRALAMFSFPSQASLVVNELVAVRDSAKAPSKNDGIDGIDGINGWLRLLLRDVTPKWAGSFWRTLQLPGDEANEDFGILLALGQFLRAWRLDGQQGQGPNGTAMPEDCASPLQPPLRSRSCFQHMEIADDCRMTTSSQPFVIKSLSSWNTFRLDRASGVLRVIWRFLKLVALIHVTSF